MDVKPGRFVDISNGVFQRIARQKEASSGKDKHGAVMAMNVGVTQLDGDLPNAQIKPALVETIWQNERFDWRIGALEGFPVAGKRVEREGMGDYFAIGKNFVARHMIIVPVAENNPDRPDRHGVQGLSNRLRVSD